MTVQHERGERVDVLIVTAVKGEWDAVLAVETGAKPGSSWERHPEAAGPEVFCRDFTIEGGVLRVGVVQAFGMGREQAAITAAPLLERHPEIRCLAMCGVCAGRRDEVALGDVIIADRAWPYDAGKLKVSDDEQGRHTTRFQGDMDLYRIHPSEWKQRAERFQLDLTASWVKERPRSYEEQGDWVLERLAKNENPKTHAERTMKCPDWSPVLKQLWKVKRLKEDELKLTALGRKHIRRRLTLEPDGLREPGPFKTVVGPIATGAPVVEDPTIFERLSDTQAMRKVVGLEMETSAILALAYLRKVPHAVVMKGVMDHADVFKSDNMKPFAAKASAECLIAFLRQNLSLDTSEHNFHSSKPKSNMIPVSGSVVVTSSQALDAKGLDAAQDTRAGVVEAPITAQDRARVARQMPMSSGEIESLSIGKEVYRILPRAEYDRIAITSRAALLVGAPEISERFIVVAQYGARDRSLASVIKFAGSDAERTRIAPPGDVQSFPPGVLLTTPDKMERHEDGATWSSDRGAKIAIATDGSVALRIRLANDRQGKGGARRRGEIGLFTTLEQLIGAILYARRLGAQTSATNRYRFRLELYPSTARLMCEPPSSVVEKHRLVAGAGLVDPWPELTDQLSSPIWIAGEVRADAGRDQLGALLDEVAHAIAVFFGVEDIVTVLHPGAITASIFEDWS